MSLQDIVSKIQSDAQAEADKIVKLGQEKIASSLADQDKDQAKEISRIKEGAKNKANQLKDQGGFRMRMIEKNAGLRAKQESVDSAFSAAREELMAIGEDKFVELYTKVFKAAPALPEAEVICLKKKTALVKQALKSAGLKYEIADESLGAGQDGAIFSSKDIEINLTIDKLVDQARENLRSEVNKILFK